MTEAATTHVVADAAPAAVPIRSPFEPLPRTSTGSWPTEPGSTGDGETGNGAASDSHAAAEYAQYAEYESHEPASYLSGGYEGSDAADFDLIPSGDGDGGADGEGALGQLRSVYASAETIGAGDSDGQFSQLLERQRQLISEYFKESGALSDGPVKIPEISDLWSAR